MRPGARVAVDVGTVRVGVAASDAHGLLASPVTTLARDQRGGRDLDELAAIVEERQAVEVIVGLPTSLSGRPGPAATAARAYAAMLAQRLVSVPVRLVDERLSTVSAERGLRASGRRGNARDRRQVVDQVAATVFLQAALDTERATGAPPGERIVLGDGSA
ncbi:MAG: Holliday junction resolvase RuvX [Frankiaceae bacterium]